MGKIYLTQDPHTILKDYSHQVLKIFECDEFKISDSKEVINEAYIFEEKVIAIIAQIFNIQAQNALLKILEEPPKGVEFLILTSNKNALLPTIRSRMQIINSLKREKIAPLQLDLANLTLKEIYDFLKSLDYLSKTQAKDIIQSLLKSIQESKIKLPQKELDFFNTALEANHHYERIHIILLPILLHLLDRNKQ